VKSLWDVVSNYVTIKPSVCLSQTQPDVNDYIVQSVD